MKEVPRSCYGKGKEHSCGTWTSCNLSRILLVQDYCVQFYCGGPFYYYYTRFKHIKLFTKVKNLKCERSQCHRRNARLYRAVLSLDLKVAMLTVISEVTVSESLFQTAGAAWQKAFLDKLRVTGLHWRMFAPRGLSCLGASYIRISSAKYCGSCLVSTLNVIGASLYLIPKASIVDTLFGLSQKAQPRSWHKP